MILKLAKTILRNHSLLRRLKLCGLLHKFLLNYGLWIRRWRNHGWCYGIQLCQLRWVKTYSGHRRRFGHCRSGLWRCVSENQFRSGTSQPWPEITQYSCYCHCPPTSLQRRTRPDTEVLALVLGLQIWNIAAASPAFLPSSVPKNDLPLPTGVVEGNAPWVAYSNRCGYQVKNRCAWLDITMVARRNYASILHMLLDLIWMHKQLLTSSAPQLILYVLLDSQLNCLLC